MAFGTGVLKDNAAETNERHAMHLDIDDIKLYNCINDEAKDYLIQQE